MDTKIIAGTLSALNLSRHIEGFKREALKLNKSLGATERGYFKPAEEEEVLHLLVSYWQSRAALLELALEMEAETKPAIGPEAQARRENQKSTHRYSAFLIAYAGMAVLVDAARFLSEQFDYSNVVRAKLNQPNREFGLPAGIYDRVQDSLNDPRHLYLIYQSNEFYKKYYTQIEKASKLSPELAALFTIIKKYKNRLNIDSYDFAKDRIQEFGRQIADYFRKPAKQQMYELQRSISKMISVIKLKPDHQPQLPKKICNELTKLIRPGDVFITRKEFALTNYFLPGYWPHAALYIGKAGELEEMNLKTNRWNVMRSIKSDSPSRVLEALKDGVHVRSMESPFGNDAMVVIRPKLNSKEIIKGIGRGLKHEAKPYDFNFDFTRSDRLICTEVIFRSYEGIGPMKFKLTTRAGRLNISAEDLLRMSLERTLFEPIAVYCPDQKKELVLGDGVDTILKASIGS